MLLKNDKNKIKGCLLLIMSETSCTLRHIDCSLQAYEEQSSLKSGKLSSLIRT